MTHDLFYGTVPIISMGIAVKKITSKAGNRNRYSGPEHENPDNNRDTDGQQDG